MDDSLYDEFGNYIGPEIESDQDSDREDEDEDLTDKLDAAAAACLHLMTRMQLVHLMGG